jgi:hypothetical protein
MMADLKLLKEVKFLPKLYLPTSPRSTMIGKIIIWRISSGGHGLESALRMYYAEETFARDVLIWLLV